MSFNPRPREGATQEYAEMLVALRVSIHAPAKGRQKALNTNSPGTWFQSTPPRRGDVGGWHNHPTII